MQVFRRYRKTIGTLLAAVLLLGAGAAEAALSLQGPDPQFPLCSAGNDPFSPATPADRTLLSDHCDICPLTGGTPGLPATSADYSTPLFFATAATGSAEAATHVSRPELCSLEGRAPPSSV